MYKLHSVIVFIFLISVTFYSFLSLGLGGGRVSIISLISPVLFVYFIFHYKPKVDNSNFFHFFYFLFFLVFIFMSTVYMQDLKLLIQLSVYVFVPIIFYILGCKNEITIILNVIKLTVLCSFFISISYFLFLGYGVNGPFGIFSKLTNFSFFIQEGWNSRILYARSSGVFPDPNTLGLFSGISLIFICFYRNLISKKEFLVYFILILICLLLSMSRGAIIALISTLIIVEISRNIYKGIKFSSAILLMALILSFLALSTLDLEGTKFSRLSSIFEVAQGNTSDGNLNSRTVAWDGVLSYVSDNVFGTILPPQLVLDLSPDNQFFYFLAQGGILLCALFVTYFVYLIFLAFSRANSKSFILAIVVFIYINSTTMVVFNNFLTSLLWFVIGIESKFKNKKERAC